MSYVISAGTTPEPELPGAGPGMIPKSSNAPHNWGQTSCLSKDPGT